MSLTYITSVGAVQVPDGQTLASFLASAGWSGPPPTVFEVRGPGVETVQTPEGPAVVDITPLARSDIYYGKQLVSPEGVLIAPDQAVPEGSVLINPDGRPVFVQPGAGTEVGPAKPDATFIGPAEPGIIITTSGNKEQLPMLAFTRTSQEADPNTSGEGGFREAGMGIGALAVGGIVAAGLLLSRQKRKRTG